jgi:predicted glycoside hydrolase/deacetylase ChbG (UPF0249 family)
MSNAPRKLIVNADDFGLSAGVNRGVIRAHDHGIVTSASLMVHKPAAVEAVELARKRPLLSLGLHIDIGEWRYKRDGWVPVYERAPGDDPQALEAAVGEQLELFRRLTGTVPTHLDSHQHVHRQEPLRSIMCRVAAELGVPLRHFNPCVSYCGDFYAQDDEGRALHERLAPSFLVEIITKLNQGATELCCHPAAELDFESPYWEERLRELGTLCAPVVIEALERKRVLLRSFAHL